MDFKEKMQELIDMLDLSCGEINNLNEDYTFYYDNDDDDDDDDYDMTPEEEYQQYLDEIKQSAPQPQKGL